MALSNRIIGAESGGNTYAANPRSTARGAGQFIESTWLDLMRKYRPDLTTGRSREEILGLRNDPELSKAMTDAYASDNAKVLSGAGLPVTDGTSYLAHFAGPQGAVGVLQADQSAPVASILGDAAVKANPFLANMTAGDLRNWADKKMGAQAAPLSSAPLSLAPPAQSSPMQLAGLLGGNSSPMGLLNGFSSLANMGAGLMGGEDNSPLPEPVVAPPVRPRVDMSRLNALLQSRKLGGSWMA